MPRLVRASLVVALTLRATLAAAQVADSSFWVTNGPVNAIVRHGNTVYLGGGFTTVGPVTGGGVPVSAATAAALPFPKVNGSINTVLADGDGGWYIGGSFDHVGGAARANLAHVRSDGVIAAWAPDPDGFVFALAASEERIYVAGDFTTIDGQPRNGLAAVDSGAGHVASWDPSPSGGPIRALEVDASRVYVGGEFTSIGGQPRAGIAALDVASGLAAAWNPGLAGGAVEALASAGSILYVAGSFTSLGGQPRSGIAAVDSSTGLVTAWNPAASDPSVHALALSGGTLYAGGYFTSIGGQLRAGLAALDVTTGLATGWNPGVSSYVLSLAVSGSTVYVGGDFVACGGATRNHVAAVDATTGVATAWDPNANLVVRAVAANGGAVFIGGGFTSVGGVTRRNLAAFDAATGAVTAWNPAPNSGVSALAASGGTIWAGGSFSNIGGQTRLCVAALDTVTGAATAWNAGIVGATPFVTALAPSGGLLYVGGAFRNIGGQPRNRIAALDTGTGAATGWNPDADAQVSALAVSANRVYVSGAFTEIGGNSRIHVAALDAVTGNATSWSPAIDGNVLAFATSGDRVFLGGAFDHIGSLPRYGLGAVDSAMGVVTGWNPDLLETSAIVYALALRGNILYAGGSFTIADGRPRHRLVALDATTGSATPWNPDANSTVNALAIAGNTVYAGGSFTTIGGTLRSGVAALTADISTAVLVSLARAAAYPDRVELEWRLAGDPVSSVTIQRREDGQPWGAVNTIAPRARAVSFTDRDVTAGRRYGYRLAWEERGAETFSGEVPVSVPSTPAFALLGARPDPSRGAPVVDLALPDAAPATLELIDVAGRCIARHPVGHLGAGRHSVDLTGTPLAPGVYTIRLERRGETLARRAVVLK